MSIKSIIIEKIGDAENTTIEFEQIGKRTSPPAVSEPDVQGTTVVDELGEMVDNAATMIEKFLQLQKPNAGNFTVGQTQDLLDEAERFVKEVERMRQP